MFMSYNQPKLAQAKGSTAKWTAQYEAAQVLETIVVNMVQVVAECDEEKKLGDKRAIVKSSQVIANTAALADALATLKSEWRGCALANHYNSLATWFAVLAKARTFAEWEEVRTNVATACTQFQLHNCAVKGNARLLVVHFSNLVGEYRKEVVQAAKKRLPPVAVPKAAKNLAIAQHYAAWTDCSTGEYIYWQPLQTARHSFKMWCIAMNVKYMIHPSGIRA